MTEELEHKIDRLARLVEGFAAERNALVDRLDRIEAATTAAPSSRRRPPTETSSQMSELLDLIRSAPAIRQGLTEALQPEKTHELELARLEVERHKTEQYVMVALSIAPSLLAAIAGKPELADAMRTSIEQVRAAHQETASSAEELAEP